MRLLVDLCRYLVYGCCALVIIVVSLFVISTIEGVGLVLGEVTVGSVLVALAALLLFALLIGGIAILVSLHDVHLKLLDEARRIAGVLDRDAAGVPEQTR